MADPTNRISITICGDGGCGKSSITLRLVRSHWTHEYDPTIEDSYTLTRRIDGQTYHLSITDTAGQEEYRGMWASSNLSGADAFLLVYDITRQSSLEGLGYFDGLIEMEGDTREDAWVRSQANSNGKQRGSGTGFVKPIKIVAGNKCDLQSERQVSAQVGLEWARRHGCGFMETSARNTVNIEETFALIVRRVVEARRAASNEGVGMSAANGMSAVSGAMGVNGTGVNGVNGIGGGGKGKGIGVRPGHMHRNTIVDDERLGTRRAATAPLSPLPGGPEKEMGFPGEDERSRISRFKEWLGKLTCWR